MLFCLVGVEQEMIQGQVLNKLMPHKKMNSRDRFSLLGKVLWGLRRGRLQNEGGNQNVNQVIRPEKKLQHLGYDDYRSLLACVHNPNNSYIILWIQSHVKEPPKYIHFQEWPLRNISKVRHTGHGLTDEWFLYSGQESRTTYAFRLPHQARKVKTRIIWKYNMHLFKERISLPGGLIS